MSPFSPGPKSVVISASAATASAKISNGRGVQQVRIHNDVSATIWIAWGGSSVQANMTSCMSMPSGAVEVLTLEPPYNDDLYIAVITASATGNVNITPGAGI